MATTNSFYCQNTYSFRHKSEKLIQNELEADGKFCYIKHYRMRIKRLFERRLEELSTGNSKEPVTIDEYEDLFRLAFKAYNKDICTCNDEEETAILKSLYNNLFSK